MIGIYKITNTVNHKAYIGQSTNIKRRWRVHKAYAQKPQYYNNTKTRSILYYEMHRYGLDSFTFEVVEECYPNQLNEREAYYINYYNTINTGYNIVPDEYHNVPIKLDDIKVSEIKELLKNSTLNQVEISEKFNVSPDVIRGINHGRYWVDTNEEYPISGQRKILRRGVKPKRVLNNNVKKTILEKIDITEFIKLYPIASNALLAKQFGISKTSVRNIGLRFGLIKKHKTNENITKHTSKASIIQYDKYGLVVEHYPSVRAAARAIGNEKYSGHISDVINGVRRSAYGYVWKRA